MSDFLVSQELLQRILDYLVTQPFKEVANIVSEITQLQPLEQPYAGPEVSGVEKAAPLREAAPPRAKQT